MKVLKIIRDICAFIFAVVIGIPLFLLILPFFLIALPFSMHKEKKHEAAYRDFLNAQNESIFFIYTTKKKTRKFVEDAILPNLPKEINVVLLEGRIPRSKLEVQFVSRLLNRQKAEGGFPWLIKISGGRPNVKSINKALYDAMRDDNPQAILSLINSL